MALNLREQDRLELAFTRPDLLPSAVVMESFYAAELTSFAILKGSRPIALFGVVGTEQEGIGCPWMLATPQILEASSALRRFTRPWVSWMNSLYPLLLNQVHADNSVAIRWLKFAGFEISPETVDVNGAPFHPFLRRQ